MSSLRGFLFIGLALSLHARAAQTSFVDIAGSIGGVRTDGAGNIFVLNDGALVKNPCRGPGFFCNGGYQIYGPLYAFAMDVGADGSAYIAGTAGPQGPLSFGAAGVAKIDPHGNVVYVTGICDSIPACFVTRIALGPDGSLWALGYINTAEPFISVLDPSGQHLTTLPASGVGGNLLAVADDNTVYVSKIGTNVVSAVSATGGLLFTATLAQTSIQGIAAGANGNLYVTGSTQGGLSTTPGAFQQQYPVLPSPDPVEVSFTPPFCTPSIFGTPSCTGGGPVYANIFPSPASGFVASLDRTGKVLFSTYLGGSGATNLYDIRPSSAGGVVVSGYTVAQDFPGWPAAAQNCAPGLFASLLSADGTSVVASYPVLPPVGSPSVLPLQASQVTNHPPYVAAASDGTIVVTYGASTVATIVPSAPDNPVACLVSSASRQPSMLTTGGQQIPSNAVTPGQLVTLFGTGLSAVTQSIQPVAGAYPTNASGLSITFDSIRAPLLYISPDQINLQVPYEAAGHGTAVMTLSGLPTGELSFNIPISDAPLATLFSVPLAAGECHGGYTGEMKPLVLNQDGTVNSCENPAMAGSTVTAYANFTGDGLPFGATGVETTSSFSLPYTFNLGYTNSISFITSVSSISATALAGTISGVYSLSIPVPNAPFDVSGNLGVAGANGPGIGIEFGGSPLIYFRVALTSPAARPGAGEHD